MTERGGGGVVHSRVFQNRRLTAYLRSVSCVSGRFGVKSYEIGGSKYEIERRAGFNVKYRMPTDTPRQYIFIHL